MKNKIMECEHAEIESFVERTRREALEASFQQQEQEQSSSSITENDLDEMFGEKEKKWRELIDNME